MTRKPIGIAVRTAIQIAAFGAAASLLLIPLTPSLAQDVAVAEIQPDLVASPLGAEPLTPGTAEAQAPGSSLTPAVLAAYVARQQAQKGFDIFGESPQPELTSAMVSAYAATHYQNSALTAIDNAAEPLPLRSSFTVEDVSFTPDEPSAADEPPSVTDDMLARYARQHFQPTDRKVAQAIQEKNCLSTAIYHEARGESDNGQWAVANVIINRAMSKRFPTTMCGVVYQNVDQGRFRCQFSFACDGQPDMATERQAWVKANRIAAAAYAEFQHGQRPGVVPGSALYYHTRSVSTDWGYKRVAEIGAHVFYSPL